MIEYKTNISKKESERERERRERRRENEGNAFEGICFKCHVLFLISQMF